MNEIGRDPWGRGDFHLNDGIYFGRREAGAVIIYRKVTDSSTPEILTQTDAGVWISLVLAMSAYNERPGDFSPMLKHHCGKADLLVGKRGGY